MLDGTYDPGLTAFAPDDMGDGVQTAAEWYMALGIAIIALVGFVGAASWF